MNFKDIDHGNSFDFGKTAAQYAKYRDIYPKELYDRLYTLGVGHKGDAWLDIGTGTGVLPKNMAHYGAEITGVDISEDQIAFARQQPEADKYKIHYIACSAEHTGLSCNSFDSITAAQCFWYFDREQLISEIKRIIKPGGVFV